MLNKCFLGLIGAVLIIAIYFPARHARHYEYVDDGHILNELVVSEPELSNKNDLKSCSYKNLILNSSDIEFVEFYRSAKFEKPRNGEFKSCFSFVQSSVNTNHMITWFLRVIFL